RRGRARSGPDLDRPDPLHVAGRSPARDRSPQPARGVPAAVDRRVALRDRQAARAARARDRMTMARIDAYLRSLEKFGAQALVLTSNQTVTLKFPGGDRHA